MVTTATERVYRVKPGRHIKPENFDRVAGEIERLCRERGGKITPPEIVDEAKSPLSPLHEQFEWDDSEAAEQWRFWQARMLVNSIEVRVVHREGPESEVRWVNSYQNVIVENGARHHAYVPTQVVQDRQDYMYAVMEKAQRELDNWRARYRFYLEQEEFRGQFGRWFED